MDKEKREQDRLKCKKAGQSPKLSPSWMHNDFLLKAVLLAGVSLIISFLITPSLVLDRSAYRLGDVAEQNIKAARELMVENEEATARKREEAVRRAPLIYDMDESVFQQVEGRVNLAFEAMRDHQTRGSGSDMEHGLWAQASPGSLSPALSVFPLDLNDLKPQPHTAKQNLERILGFPITEEVFLNLEDTRFNQDLQHKVVQLLKSVFEQGIVANKAWLLHAQAESLVFRKSASQEEQLLMPPHSFQDVEDARKSIRIQAMEQGGDADEMMMIAFLMSNLLQPNLTFNLEETERRREQAYSSIEPIYIHYMKNEMLVREGQRIGSQELRTLRMHDQGKSDRHIVLVFTTMFLFCGLCIWVVTNVAREHLPSFRMEWQDLLFLAMLLVFLLAIGRATLWLANMVGESSVGLSGRMFLCAVPLSAGAMMACIFFGVTVSLIFSLLLTLFAGMLFGRDFGLFFYFLIGSFIAAHCVSSCRARMIPIRAGLLVGLANAILIVLGAFIQDQFVFFRVLTDILFGLCGGVLAGVLVAGFTPLIEMLFGYTTDIKLLELATMDQPLLQELMVQAPGTYHHSIIVGNMVEAAAKSIGANSLLAKVAAYYHDIGKIKKPLYFIENQFDCENRHEKLAPSMSSLILISHVKEGVELARQHRLGKSIIDIISQHHGKSFISFFYNKALETREKAQAGKGSELPPINMDDYRYPGPKPQTKEAGLIMLADVAEAACRSLTEPTPARIQGLVNRLINNIFSDGQLDECELTLKDLHHIAKHFHQILATVHHKRIEYPAVAAANGKGKADASDSAQRESKSDRDKPCANRERSRTDLKRLGMH